MQSVIDANMHKDGVQLGPGVWFQALRCSAMRTLSGSGRTARGGRVGMMMNYGEYARRDNTMIEQKTLICFVTKNQDGRARPGVFRVCTCTSDAWPANASPANASRSQNRPSIQFIAPTSQLYAPTRSFSSCSTSLIKSWTHVAPQPFALHQLMTF